MAPRPNSVNTLNNGVEVSSSEVAKPPHMEVLQPTQHFGESSADALPVDLRVGSPQRREISRRELDSSSNSIPSMFKQIERLKSFEGWPVTFLSPSRLAAAGFYYIKDGDIVRCPFCNVEVGHWVCGDDPIVDHKKWSPTCKFVRNVPGNGNIPISESDVLPESEGQDVCGPYGINLTEENLSLEELNVQKNIRPPIFSNYVTFESRIKSFESWPVSLKLKPETLSDAGFFYTGKGDQTLCYHCGGGLKDWEETDEPWVEHARWFSKCNYVILVKGQSFIDEVSGQKNKNLPEMKSTCSVASIPDVQVSGECKKEADVASESGSSDSEDKNLDSRTCKICYGAEMGVAFLPCGHVVACPRCASSLTNCASCRQKISATVRIYLS